MARLPGFELLGHPQHVIVHGNNRQMIFVAGEDYAFYVEKLAKGCRRYQKSRADLIDCQPLLAVY